MRRGSGRRWRGGVEARGARVGWVSEGVPDCGSRTNVSGMRVVAKGQVWVRAAGGAGEIGRGLLAGWGVGKVWRGERQSIEQESQGRCRVGGSGKGWLAWRGRAGMQAERGRV